MKVVLFDIDGTLIHANGIGSAATRLAMQAVFGTVGTLDNFRFGGKTDWEMLLETLHGIVDAITIEQTLSTYDDELRQHMQTLIADYEVFPCVGAGALVAQVLAHSEACIAGILTANMPSGAHIKLRAGGYNPDEFLIQVFGSEAPTRLGLPPLAMQRTQALLQRDIAPEDVIVIGDTPHDIACAKHNGNRSLAVATGRYSVSELATHQPDFLVEDLSDTAHIWACIMG